MNTVELDMAPLEGELNVHSFVRRLPDRVELMRFPKKNNEILRSIANEYHGVGFTSQGGRFRRRRPQEQVAFTRYAASQGLRVLEPSFVNAKGVSYFPFLVQAKTLDDYLPTAPTDDSNRIVFQIYDDLRRAHQTNIIYGDRWFKNMLVTPTFGAMHIDFDIEISGHAAKEFEVAQVTYYTLLAAGDRPVISLVAEMLSRGRNLYNHSTMMSFLQQHVTYFQDNQSYGGIENKIDTLLGLIHKK